MDAANVTAIIAAASALAGAFLTQGFAMLQKFLDQKHQKQVFLRQKLEELASHLYQTTAWAELWANHFQAKKLGEPLPESPRSSEEARRVYVLSLLYFPALKDESLSLMLALNTLLGGDEAKLQQAVKQYAAARDALNALIAAEAQKII